MSEQVYFKTSSFIKNIVGQDLITNKFSAVFELVKNSYDAGAQNVDILFDFNHNTLEITDDGSGMSKDDILNKWLFLAYSNKQEGNINNYNRALVGAKGIGRMSCDRLGSVVEITTRKVNENIAQKLTIYWDDFEKDNSKEINSIPVLLEEVQVSKIAFSGSGTQIKILNLRDNWDEVREEKKAVKKENEKYSDINLLERHLMKLLTPYGVADFNIHLKSIGSHFKDIDKTIKNDLLSLLKEKTAYVKAEYKDNRLIFAIFDENVQVFLAEKKWENNIFDNHIEFLIYHMSQKANYNFTQRAGVRVREYGSILVYKNGFRVFPYGDANFDTFNLDMRKTQGHSRFLGNRDLLGFIGISDDTGVFKEASSRDNGFVHTKSYFEFEKMFHFIHREFEAYIQLKNFGKLLDQETGKEVGLRDINESEIDIYKKRIKKRFDIIEDTFENVVPKIVVTPEKIVHAINQQIKNQEEISLQDSQKLLDTAQDLLKENKNLENENKKKAGALNKAQKQVENQEKLVSKITEIETNYSHHFKLFESSLAKSNSEIVKIANSLEQKSPKEIKESLYIVAEKVNSVRNELEAYRYYLDTFSDKESPTTDITFDIKKELTLFFEKMVKEEDINITFLEESEDIKYLVKGNLFQFLIACGNIFKNIEDFNAENIEVIYEENRIRILSDTPFILEEDIPHIFELGFSTKINGTGFGMYQVKKYFDSLQFEVLIFNNTNEKKVELNIIRKDL